MATQSEQMAQATGGNLNFVLMAAFTASIFISASLLFAVQPMFTKMALPFLGGAPNVWNTAMVFFQAMLLGGYIYAHILSKYLSLPLQLAVHIGVLAFGLIFLPIAISPDATPAMESPALWLIGLFAASLGAPFFALSAQAPLLQRWFSYTSHPHAHDPYFMYAASNLGSLLVLCAYPLVIEPSIGLTAQSASWMYGYIILIAFIAGAGLVAIFNSDGQAKAKEIEDPEQAEEISWKRRLQWVSIAFVPSSLMLGVTSHLSANVAAAPFIWVGPLALYLLTFVFAFAKKPAIRPQFIEWIFPIAVILGLIYISLHVKQFALAVGATLLIFFVITQHCHNKLAALRPSVSRLTEFYLAMSLGGVLGGAFTALAAPVLFNDVYEYPMMIIASVLTGAGALTFRSQLPRIAIAVFIGIGPILLAAWIFNLIDLGDKIALPMLNVVILGIGFLLYRMRNEKLVFASGLSGFAVALSLAFAVFNASGTKEVLFKERSFFGVIRVVELTKDYGTFNTFIHGDTTHNMQLREEDVRREPLAYYSRGGPFGQTIDALRENRERKLNVALIGLGAGAMACYAEDGEEWTFYEIDPTVVDMARNDRLFRYVNDCQPNSPIKIGDARLQIATEKDASFDAIFVDAFSSDSIPAHLITREALALYRQKLISGGVIFFHTSNRVVDVTSVAAAIAHDAGLSARGIFYSPTEGDEFSPLRSPTNAVLVGEETVLAALLEGREGWGRVEPHRYIDAWTDDYSHIIGAIAAESDGGPKILND
ncbi:MAG: fused MFS/spermidine synthase [Marinicaulis sp.]|nr:fused MFS/spermidine synthase [Marinicaulis sp.]